MSRSHALKVELEEAKFLSFWGDAIIQVQYCPSDQTTAPSKTQFNQHEERPFKGFSPQTSTILASRKTYQKLSSNGLDLAELEPKPVDHRQIRIYPVISVSNVRSCEFSSKMISAAHRCVFRLISWRDALGEDFNHCILTGASKEGQAQAVVFSSWAAFRRIAHPMEGAVPAVIRPLLHQITNVNN
jgi:hypothetical protein